MNDFKSFKALTGRIERGDLMMLIALGLVS